MQKPNKIERLKTDLLPAEFKLESVDWSRPDEAVRFYLKNYGIYNIKLRHETWMIRLRFDGGFITTTQLLILAEISKEEHLRILLTARSQMELHDLTAVNVYPVWQKLKKNGFESCQVLTDNFRGILLDPLDGIVPDSRIDCRPILREIRKKILCHREWLGTIPRKFNTAIIGSELPSVNPWGNDLLFALAQRDSRWGFNLYLGGKNSEVAQNADIFCLPQEAPSLFEAVARTYKNHGLRGSRSRTRLFHLIEEAGMEQIRKWIEDEFGAPLSKKGELMMRSSTLNRDHLLPIRRYGHHGEISFKELAEAAQEAQTQNLILRLTPHQELWAFNPKEIQEKSSIFNPQSSIPPAGRLTACAGARYCPLSLWEIKTDSEHLPLRILTDYGVSVGFSGCLKGCGRHHQSDIGLVGLRSNAFGPTERALRIFVGATQAPDPSPARLLFYAVPERSIERLFTVIVEDFTQSGCENFEDFSREILNHYATETLMLWYLLRQQGEIEEGMQSLFGKKDNKSLKNRLLSLSNVPAGKEAQEVISDLSHRLWDNF